MTKPLKNEPKLCLTNQARWLCHQTSPNFTDDGKEDSADANKGGYQQIPDTSWWEGAKGEVVDVGGRIYQPAEQDASLTLAAVYRWDRHPCYWLTVTHGSLIERDEGGERIIEELLIPAVQGGQLGAAWLAVGRLAAPITSAHRLKPGLKRRAARQAAVETEYLGNLLAKYQQHEGLSELELAARLGCSLGALDDIFLCLRLEAGELQGAAFNRYVRLVASVAGVPAHLLGATLREALLLERNEELATA